VSTHPSEPERRRAGEQSRERLLHAALNLFAERGYSRTSTRDIAEAAGTNLAAIRYYFGDKAGLYRAAFFEPHATPPAALLEGRDLTLGQALRALFCSFLTPLAQGDLTRQCMRLHMREMLEPTGLWQEEIDQGIRPLHDALLAALCRHVGVRRADDELRRLAICIAALGVHLHVAHDITDALAPRLNAAPKALDAWLERLVMYAEAMVAAEVERRAAIAPTKPGRAARRHHPETHPS
jgi:AcrR family transcriptional regulator